MKPYLKLQTKMTRAKPRMVSCGRSGHKLAHNLKRASVQTNPPGYSLSFDRRQLAELVIIILVLA
jgi:hypothetical protein